MAQPVWTLSVDLQTKTATFTSGLADAAKGARTSFEDIKAGANDMGREVGGNMTEARHGVMLLGEEFGVHLPRALTSFIASIGPIGAAMEAAFPFLAIIVGATLLIEHLIKLKEAGAAIDSDWRKIGESASAALGRTKDAILEAEIEADKFSGDKLDALHKRLILIDHQSMRELVSEFNKVGDEIDKVLEKSTRGTIMSTLLGEGAANKVKTEFDSFREQYAALLNTGKDSQARGALVDEIIHAQDQLKKYQAMPQGNRWVADAVKDYGQLIDKLDQLNALQDYNTTLNSKEKKNAVTAVDDSAARAEYTSAEKYDDLIAKAHKKLNDELEKQADDIGKIQGARLRSQVESEVKAQKEMAEAAKLTAEGGKEQAEHETKMGELANAARHEQEILHMSGMMNAAKARMAGETRMADEEFALKTKEGQQEIAALDKTGKEYENKLKALNDKQLQLTRAHENQLTQIKLKAEEERNSRMISAEKHIDDAIAKSLTSTLMSHKSFTKEMAGLANQIMSGMMETAIKSVLANDYTKESDAAAAARKAYLAGMKFPFPANIVMGPALGAMAFASVMAFEEGGMVPGVGTGDIVPARLEPGEGIITKKVMEGLANRAKFGGEDKTGGDTHIHNHTTNHVHAIDGPSVRRMLTQHSDEFERHFNNHLRKMNK